MRAEPFSLGGMPALRWGRPSRRGILYLHGQGGSKAEAAFFAAAAADAARRYLGALVAEYRRGPSGR